MVDLLNTDDRYIVKLDVFEGPLDLLLHLIRKHELDIFNIPISFVTSKYLEYLDMMKKINLDLASDYLEMAATLALIKSRMMLPQESNNDDEEEDDGPDPREELVRRLLEYQKYKTAAQELSSRPMLGRDTFPKAEANEEQVERELSSPGLFALVEAFHKVLKRAQPVEEQMHHVDVQHVSLSERIRQLVEMLRERTRVTFEEFFEGQRTKGDMVVTFLSLLEMTKLGLTTIYQAGPLAEIHIIVSDNLDNVEKTLAERFLEE